MFKQKFKGCLMDTGLKDTTQRRTLKENFYMQLNIILCQAV